ncbi:MAG: four helix bundle protein [Bacteroidales bacterium]|nr:four helix bundle protein [Bacteroidales bacterium]
MIDERMTSFFRFTDLRVYGKALAYSKWVMGLLQDPRSEGERYLFNAFFRSANDIALNIAEGSSRTNTQFEHYLRISKSAVRECVTYTEMCYNMGLMGDMERDQSHDLLIELMRMIGALIVSLNRNGGRRKSGDEHGAHGDTDSCEGGETNNLLQDDEPCDERPAGDFNF